MPRLAVQTPIPLTRNANNEAVFPAGLGHPNAKRLSYHEDFGNFNGPLGDLVTGQCTPDCPEGMPFPWTIKVNGEDAHSFNAGAVPGLVGNRRWRYLRLDLKAKTAVRGRRRRHRHDEGYHGKQIRSTCWRRGGPHRWKRACAARSAASSRRCCKRSWKRRWDARATPVSRPQRASVLIEGWIEPHARRTAPTATAGLLDRLQLTAELPTGVSGGMYVHVPEPRHHVVGMGIRQCGLAFK